jgi:hypothetical protein
MTLQTSFRRLERRKNAKTSQQAFLGILINITTVTQQLTAIACRDSVQFRKSSISVLHNLKNPPKKQTS